MENKENNVVQEKVEKKGRNSLTSRAFRKGTFATIIICLFVVAIILINVISNVLVERFNILSFDLSSNQINQLSDDSIDIINSIDEEMTIKILASKSDIQAEGDLYVQADAVANQYDKRSDNITLEYVDLYANPSYSNNYPNESIAPGYFIVEQGENYRVLTEKELFNWEYDSYTGYESVTSINAENAISTAILNISQGSQTKITFINGFGSYDADAFKSLLRLNNYDVLETAILTEDIDPESDVIILFAPTVDLTEENVEELEAFLENDGKKGKTLFYVPSYAPEEQVPNLTSFLEDWGMELEQGYSFEMDSSFVASDGSSIVNFTDTYYTENLKDSTLPIIQVNGVPITITNEGMARSLLATSSSVFVPYDIPEDFNPENEEQTVHNIGAASMKTSEDGESASTLIVFGSSYMFYEGFLEATTFNNGDYFVNILNIHSDKEDAGLSIVPKAIDNPALGIYADQYEPLGIIFAIAIPILILIAGVVVWRLRRNK